ncbi:hypothetical protein HPB48_022705 [Haemaphysalis longicornis]|uniref:Endonuclease/exonuclease/phosphatase domain-containing protein n=1 Tax=Haemaphysalis longicornis TaxID=44386 RepID=A0A9J6FXW2_HAELO|nr:hypothetical protein HPB48_022705 [Haemaphysalis longicornis]
MDVLSHTIFRNDRRSRGGGVHATTPTGIPVHGSHDLEHSELEGLFLELYLRRGSLLIGCVYCAPKFRNCSYTLLYAAQSNIDTNSVTDIVLFGGFNAHFDWCQHDEPLPRDAADDSLLDVVTSASLHQVCQHRSLAPQDQPSFIDLVFVRKISRVTFYQVLPGLTGRT